MTAKKKSFCAALLFFAVLLVLQAAYEGYCGTRKQNMFVDELYTFSAANAPMSFDNGELPYGELLTPQEVEAQYFSTPAGGRFTYGRILTNLEADPHPPLYYFLIHTICSIFCPEYNFSAWKWIGLGVNIVFALGSTVLAGAIAYQISKRWTVACAAGLYLAFLPGMTDMVMFLRMYILAGFWALALALVHVIWWSRKLDAKFLLLAAGLSLAGLFTHYYFLLYLFFLCLLFGLRLLAQKRWKEAFAYGFTMLGTVGAMVAIYPITIDKFLHGNRGNEAVSNLTDASFKGRLDAMEIENNYFAFGGAMKLILVAIAVLAAFAAVQVLRKRYERIGGAGPAWLLLGMGTAYFLLVSKIAAYSIFRYVYLVTPLVIVAVVCLIDHVAAYYCREERRAPLSLLLVLVIISTVAFSVKADTYGTMYTDTNAQIGQMHADGIDTIVYVMDMPFRTMASFHQQEQAAHIMYLAAEEERGLTAVQQVSGQDFYVYLSNTKLSGLSADDLYAEIQQQLPQYEITYRYSVDYANVYFCHLAA